MKDVFMQKVTQISPCLTDSAEASLRLLVKVSASSLTQTGGYRFIRRSAAMIGLAMSMSAIGMVLSHKATATTGNGTLQTTLADLSKNAELETNTIPKEETTETNSTQATASLLKAPTLKYKVQQSESFGQFSKEFQVQSTEISDFNKASSESDLITGQTIKISATNTSNTVAKVNPLQTTLAPSVIQNPRNLNSSQFQEQRIAISERQNQTSSDNIAPVPQASPVPEKGAIADISDVSQPLQVISPQENQFTNLSDLPKEAINRQVTVATGTFDHPIPIVVPTPETQGLPKSTDISLTKVKAPLTSLPTNQLPRKRENNLSEQSSQAIAVSKLESAGSASNPPQNSGNFNTPITIPVSTPENASLPNLSQSQEPLSTPSSKVDLQPVSNQSTASSSDAGNQFDFYSIKPGDTIDKIAKKHGISTTAVIEANQLSDPNLIKVNQNLFIPTHHQANKNNPTITSQLPNIDNSNLTTIPIPVALVAPRITIKTVQPTLIVPIAVDAPTATYTDQLKKDINRLQQSYASESRPLIVSTQKIDQGSDYQETLENKEVNPEWNGTAIRKEYNRPLSKKYVTPKNSLQQLQRRYQPSGVSQAQIIGSAPIDVENYNNNFNTPVGQEVSPDLPTLLNPDFPNTPTNLTGGYIWPAKGVLSSGYGRRWGKMHKGIDIAAPIGTPIVAAAAGEVLAAGWNSGGYGNLVKIRHVDGSITFYAHNSRILVRQGEEIAQGQQISEMGSTGRSTGPHLHFEVRPNGEKAANPIAYLPSNRS